MPVYEITLKGFDDTSRTDHLVKWIKAKSLEGFVEWRTVVGLNEFILNIRNLSFEFPSRNFDDGLDFIVGESINTKTDKWKDESAAAIIAKQMKDLLVKERKDNGNRSQCANIQII